MKFCERFRVRQTTEEGRRTYRPKRSGKNNKDEDNSPKTLSDKKELTCHLLGFAVSADHKVKIKENQKIDKYLDLAKELKQLWYLKVKVITIVLLQLE